jgi:TolA-binding protein
MVKALNFFNKTITKQEGLEREKRAAREGWEAQQQVQTYLRGLRLRIEAMIPIITTLQDQNNQCRQHQSEFNRYIEGVEANLAMKERDRINQERELNKLKRTNRLLLWVCLPAACLVVGAAAVVATHFLWR